MATRFQFLITKLASKPESALTAFVELYNLGIFETSCDARKKYRNSLQERSLLWRLLSSWLGHKSTLRYSMKVLPLKYLAPDMAEYIGNVSQKSSMQGEVSLHNPKVHI